jgi:hypothetical protein
MAKRKLHRSKRRRRVGGDGENSGDREYPGNVENGRMEEYEQPMRNYDEESRPPSQQEEMTRQPSSTPASTTSTSTSAPSSESFLGKISSGFKNATMKLRNWLMGTPNQDQVGGRRRRRTGYTRKHRRTHRK